MEPTFRLASEGDLDALAEFVRRFYAEDQTFPLDEAVARRVLAGMIGDPSLGRVWMIHDGAEPIGYLALTFGYSLEYHGRDSFIDEFYIKESHRSRGAGAAAMRFLDSACRELGVHAVHLEVERVNTTAQGLYRKFGFEDHDRYLMTRWISR